MKIRLLAAAERDLEVGADFYESQRDGLGVYFNDSLASDIESLRLFAGVHEKYLGLFRALSKRFPFAIYYRFDGATVDVVAVLDCRRNPQAIDATLEQREEP